jgi:hypothetical protein
LILRIKIQWGRGRSRDRSEALSFDLNCPKCSKSITADGQFCPHCKAVIVRKYCPGCNKLIPDHILVCPYCETTASDKPKIHGLQLSTSGVALGLAVLFITGFLFWPQRKEVNPTEKKFTTSSAKTAATASTSNPQAVQRPQQKIAARVPQTDPKTKGQDEQKIREVAQLNLKGHALIKQGNYQNAVPVLYQAVRAFPEGTNRIDYVFAQYNLGHSLRKIGKPKEAIPYLERCVAYDRSNRMFQLELQAALRDITRKTDS